MCLPMLLMNNLFSGTTTQLAQQQDRSVFCYILCIMKRVIGQVLNALPLLLDATLHRKVELGL